MYGWRARIGCIHPRRGLVHPTVIEMEMLAPEGVLLNHTFLDGPKSLAPEHVRELMLQLEPAAREVSRIGVEAIIHLGAPIALVNGVAGDRKIIETIEKATNVPATTCVSSIVKALQRLNVQKVVVFTPYYTENVAEMLRRFLEYSGIEVISLVRGGDVEFSTISEIPQQQTYRLAKVAFLKAPPADGLLIVGGGCPTSEIVEVLETDIGKPVVSHNCAALWNVLNMVSVRQPIKGFGKLLTCF